MKGSQGRNLNARTDAETIEKTCFLACSHDLLSLLSCITKHHLPRQHCLQWSGLLKPTIHYTGKCSTDLSASQYDGGISSVEVPLPRVF